MAYTTTKYRPGQHMDNARIYIALLASRERVLGVPDRRLLFEESDSGGCVQSLSEVRELILDSDATHQLSWNDAMAAAKALWRLVPPIFYERNYYDPLAESRR